MAYQPTIANYNAQQDPNSLILQKSNLQEGNSSLIKGEIGESKTTEVKDSSEMLQQRMDAIFRNFFVQSGH